MNLEKPKYSIIKVDSAHRIPEEWDSLVRGIFQEKDFLVYNEEFNPCQQRYYLVYDSDILSAAAVVYTISVDLFTFSNIPSPFKMNIIGLPVSVSLPGIFGKKEAVEHLIAYLLEKEKGLKTGLNINPEINTGDAIILRMLPTLELSLKFSSWMDYLEHLRAPYRRRCLQISEKMKSINAEKTTCSFFTDSHYRLYLDVLKHSTTKLETLSLSYFKNLPPSFQLTTYYRNEEIISLYITCFDIRVNRFYFFFGGHNYFLNKKTNAYFNNLIGVLKDGIEKRCDFVDFGQTAEIPKMRLGSLIIPKALFIYHSNPVVFWILKRFKKLIAYRKEFPEHNVFNSSVFHN